jgi:hypothetical protein
VLRGVRAIAQYRREPERRTHYLLECGYLPGYQIGSRWEMRRSVHAAMIAKQERDALARIASNISRRRRPRRCLRRSRTTPTSPRIERLESARCEREGPSQQDQRSNGPRVGEPAARSDG